MPRREEGLIRRRTLLIGAGGVVLAGVAGAFAIEAGLLPGRTTLHELLGLNGEAGVIPDVEPGPIVHGEFVSAARLGASCGWTIAYPPGAAAGDALPVLVVLHGYGGDNTSAFDELGLDRFLAAAVDGGAAPFTIASVDGGNTYWHARASGEDAGAMVTDEFIPLLAEHGLATDRVGFLGWSMGGYGSLLIASLLGPSRVASVVAESPAMWQDGAHSPDGAFDDADDYARNDLAGKQSALAGIPVRVDCGTGDGFYPVVERYVSGFDEAPAGEFESGGHDFDFWRRMAPAQLAFVAKQFE
ncbi:MAG TPA: alpha/beta hydrolase-fold protein [Pseudolysinimonas sp.]